MRPPRFFLTIHLIQRYFASGWAFLIPYLAAYLLYYITGWPVNPAPGASLSPPTPASPLTLQSSPTLPLLHLYWILHVVHIIMAGAALRAWWREKSRPSARSALAATYPTRSGLAATPSYSLPATRYSLLTALAPWALLALIFYIPGVYLEWPSDPWEHLRRINEWRILDTVGAHSAWHKSSYFIPYSLLSWCTGLRQLFWLDFYYTGICLLLCWQYYKLARACGLGERASMVFVIVQALLFGNNIFSFYRYYGISSSIYAQLGAIALTRIVLEFAARGTSLGAGLQEETKETDTPVAHGIASTIKPPLRALLATRYPLPSTHDSRLARAYSLLATQYSLLISVPSLIALTAFNHIQGIGIAGLGIAAILAWRLIEWKRAALWWLIGGMLVVNAAFLWLYPRPEIIETYRAQGWLNAWYGFNILDLTSPAGDRMLQIMGPFGLINSAAALLLLRKRHAVAALSLVPVIILIQPLFSISFCAIISNRDSSDIVTMQRMLFSIPTGLAMVEILSSFSVRKRRLLMNPLRKPACSYFSHHALHSTVEAKSSTLLLSFAFATALTYEANSYNRPWHSLEKTPRDLSLQAIWLDIDQSAGPPDSTHYIMTTSIPGYISGILIPDRTRAWGATARHYALTGRNPIDDPPAVKNEAKSELGMLRTKIVLIRPTSFVTAGSLASHYSSHWPPQEASLSSFAFSEMIDTANHYKLSVKTTSTGVIIESQPAKALPNSSSTYDQNPPMHTAQNRDLHAAEQ